MPLADFFSWLQEIQASFLPFNILKWNISGLVCDLNVAHIEVKQEFFT